MTNWLIVTGVSILGLILYYMDQKRLSDPCYKFKVKKRRDEMIFEDTEKIKYQLLTFPASNNKKRIKKFVIQEIEKGEECMENENYDKAVEHFANGLSLIDSNCTLLNILSKNVPLKMYRKIQKQIEKIKILLPEINILTS